MADTQDKWFSLRKKLDDYLVKGIDPTQSRLAEAMHYSLSLKGKRLRPLLFFTTIEALQGDPYRFLDVAACLEIIHTYSLIHDDLPCMDNDDLRRGMPTVHRQFDEATALLAGDTLLTWAFERLANAECLDADQTVAIIRLITHAIGIEGMAGGQGLDLSFNGEKANISKIHRLKTAELIRASMAAAAIACRREDLMSVIESSALAIGLAFQLADDLLDEVGDPDLVGKKLRKDAGNQSPNAVLYLGRERVENEISRLYQQAVKFLEQAEIASPAMKSLYEKMAFRTA